MVLDNADGVGINEGSSAVGDFHAGAGESIAGDFYFVFDDVVNALPKIIEGYVFFDGETASVDIALSVSGEEDDGFAQGFGWNGSDVGADAADDVSFFYDDDAFAEFDPLNGGALPGRAGSDDE